MFGLKGEHKQILEALQKIGQNGYMIYARANGEIAGLCPPEADQTYHDEKLNTKRKRIKFWRIDGTKDLEKKDGLSREKENIVDLLPIEKTGALALTRLNGDGDIIPIYTGGNAEKLKEEINHYKAKADELEDIQQENRVKDNNYKKLQKKVNNLKEEKSELEDDVEEFRTSNERLNRENETYKARNQTLLSWKRQLTQELKAMEDRHETLEDEIRNIREKAEDTRAEQLAASQVEGISRNGQKMVGKEALESGGEKIAEEEASTG